MNRIIKNAIFSIIALLPILYLCIIWDSIPATVPLHFNAHLKPNRFGSRQELLWISLLVTGISLFCYYLFQYINFVDPKRRGKPLPKSVDKLSVALVIFTTAINFLVIIASAKTSEVLKYAMMPMIGLMFIFLGNYMYNIKPNYFAGFRTPWALNDDENWRKTHKLGGSLFFSGGIVLTIASLLFPLYKIDKVFIYGVLLLALIPYLYSFILFKKSGKAAETKDN